jgi:hypothetical protein
MIGALLHSTDHSAIWPEYCMPWVPLLSAPASLPAQSMNGDTSAVRVGATSTTTTDREFFPIDSSTSWVSGMRLAAYLGVLRISGAVVLETV